MRACIYGAGAMGTVLGAYIAAKGKQIDLINRNESHVAALKEKGAHVTGTVDFTVKVTALTPAEMTGKYDVVFLMTKQRQNAETVNFLKDYLSDNGVICTTQNGLPEFSVASVVGEEKCLGCAISWGATFIGGGEAMLTSSPDKLTFALGSAFTDKPDPAKINAVKSYLECMGEVTVDGNFIGARWSKMIMNATFSSLSAISGLTFGEIAQNRKTRKAAQVLLKECMDVAAAAGVKPAKMQGHDIVKAFNYNNPVKKAVSFALLPLAMKKHKLLVSSMYYDLIKGRKCDIDFVCGEVARQGAILGVRTPVADRAIAFAHEIEEGKREISPDNISELTAKRA